MTDLRLNLEEFTREILALNESGDYSAADVVSDLCEWFEFDRQSPAASSPVRPGTFESPGYKVAVVLTVVTDTEDHATASVESGLSALLDGSYIDDWTWGVHAGTHENREVADD